MDKGESHKKENQSICNKTQAVIECKAILECEALCKEILKCIHEPVAKPKVKKERELLEGVTEYFIFWN
jgi:hypothetical protein